MARPIIIGDFAELEKAFEEGKISRDDYQKEFEKSRLHGLQGDIFPFAVGGSDAPIILGVSPWTSPLLLYRKKMGQYKENVSDPQKELTFFTGHVFEGPFREAFSKISGLKTEPCTLQVKNPEYPHIVANIDGLVWENGELGIYEGKTTRYSTATREKFSEGIVPIYYEYQIQLYMEIWDLDFTYINCAWGLNLPRDMAYIRVERDRELGKQICTACENFVQDAIMGILPDNSVCMDQSVVAKDAEKLYGKADPTLPAVKLPDKYKATFSRLDKLEEREKELKEAIAPYEEKIKEIENEMKTQTDKLKEIEKERTSLLRLFPEELKNATQGILKSDEGTWIVNYDPSKGYSLDASVKAYWKENFPESFDAVTNLKPNYTRRLSYKKVN